MSNPALPTVVAELPADGAHSAGGAVAAPRSQARSHARLIRGMAAAAALLCLGVVVLGAYVRLSNAGLGCPDWPGCYGHMAPATAGSGGPLTLVPGAPELMARPIEAGKAWREMAHRYAAGTLASILVAIAVLGIRWRRERIVSAAYTGMLVAVVALQAALGMLTVTWQLKPLIVTLHLLFGLTTLSLLWWLVLTLWRQSRGFADPGPGWAAAGNPAFRTARLLALGGLSLLAVQIALGGWTSSNYAAIACPDFPTCQASWWPQADFHSAFVLWRDANIDYEGGVLTGPARVAIHLTHRIGATATALTLLATALFCLRGSLGTGVRRAAAVVLLLLGVQLSIGIEMVLRGFPLALATAHNAGAAVLLLAMVTLNRELQPASSPLQRVDPQAPRDSTVPAPLH